MNETKVNLAKLCLVSSFKLLLDSENLYTSVHSTHRALPMFIYLIIASTFKHRDRKKQCSALHSCFLCKHLIEFTANGRVLPHIHTPTQIVGPLNLTDWSSALTRCTCYSLKWRAFTTRSCITCSSIWNLAWRVSQMRRPQFLSLKWGSCKPS